MTTLSLPAPAKLNLFLHIVGRRADGYHELQSVMQFIDLADHLTLQTRTDNQINLNINGPYADNLRATPVEDNLIYQAAARLQRIYAPQCGVDIHLEKNIPCGAGLGGGSADAATTLLALNQLWQCQLTAETLLALGEKLGADVPFFLYGHAAWVEGIGEQLTAMDLPEPWYLVLISPDHVSTKNIFTHTDLPRNTPRVETGIFPANAHNDCEKLVCQQYPNIHLAMQWLKQFAIAKLTGTGNAVFASFKDKATAEKLMTQVPAPLKAIIARGMNCNPALQQLIKLKAKNKRSY
jgi:4-diphosphocytidyl-2-C-methyl-D-erythritol kinase